MDRFEAGDDSACMTVLELTNPTGLTQRGRFGRRTHGHPGRTAVSDSGTTKLEEIRERVANDAYEVDVRKVADAIIERLLAGRAVREAGAR
jgi:hypothetical protein